MLLFIFHIVGYDIWFYYSHIILHHPAFYHWHKQHHRNTDPIWYDAYDSSIQETIFQGLGIVAPYAVYTFEPYQLMAALLFIALRGAMRHDARCISLIGNHHLIHHETFNYNYGEPWLDWVAGTDHPDGGRRKYGLVYY